MKYLSIAKDYPTSLSRPINATAARVVQEGVHYEPKVSELAKMWDSPPPTLPASRSKFNLIGQRRDRLTIAGLYDDSDHPSGSLWVARCDCGTYCLVRRRHFVRKQSKNRPFLCPKCRAVSRERYQYEMNK